jgi:hypothetical protein
MVNQRMIVAWMFRIGAILIGVPALLGLIQLIASVFMVYRIAQPVSDLHALDIQKYGLVGMLWDSGAFLGVIFQMLAGLGIIVAILISIALVSAIAFAILFFFTGNGVARRADWAKVMGIVLSAMCLLFWLSGLLNAQHADIAVAAVGVVLSAYAIWVLGWRYA